MQQLWINIWSRISGTSIKIDLKKIFCDLEPAGHCNWKGLCPKTFLDAPEFHGYPQCTSDFPRGTSIPLSLGSVGAADGEQSPGGRSSSRKFLFPSLPSQRISDFGYLSSLSYPTFNGPCGPFPSSGYSVEVLPMRS